MAKKNVIHYVVCFLDETGLSQEKFYSDEHIAREVYNEAKQVKGITNVELQKRTCEILERHNQPLVARVFYNNREYDDYVLSDNDECFELLHSFLSNKWSSVSFFRNRKKK